MSLYQTCIKESPQRLLDRACVPYLQCIGDVAQAEEAIGMSPDGKHDSEAQFLPEDDLGHAPGGSRQTIRHVNTVTAERVICYKERVT